MSTIILKFQSLAQLCAYSKTVQPQGYTINTLQNTLAAKLTSFELSIAIEQYNATYFRKEVLA